MTKAESPKYIFETSWEVCNLVGGIYTVLSTRARTLYETVGDKLVFIGPDVWKSAESPFFEEDKKLLKDWKKDFEEKYGLKVRVGRWKITSSPVAILVDFYPLLNKKNSYYSKYWELYGVDSLHAYGDYDESSMFGVASGMIMESYYKYFKLKRTDNVVAHFNEWMTTFGLFYIKNAVPEISTIFTTHATSIGRSIAGNNKPLYNYMNEYNGDQMAAELNMQSKHSTEKIAAHISDCFTTVSTITGEECTQLLEKTPTIITPNGFEPDFVPVGRQYTTKRNRAKKRLREVAETLLGYSLSKDVQFVCTAGRYEYKNKGIDVFIESLKRVSDDSENKKEVVAFVMTPAHIYGAREDLKAKLNGENKELDSWNKHTTHQLYDFQNDPVMSAIRWFHLMNNPNEKVKIIFVPSYLNGDDGVFNMAYWDLLIGMDITVFPSYYEPWGYTPLESIAFSVPTITTNLAGFGQWKNECCSNIKGVDVVNRSDYNFGEVSYKIANLLCDFFNKKDKEQKEIAKGAFEISKKAEWSEFIKYYYQAYNSAIKNRNIRIKDLK